MQLHTAAEGNVFELAFSPDGLALAAAVVNHTAFLWDVPATGAPRRLSEQHTYMPRALVFSPDSKSVSWVADHKRMEFDRQTGAEREVQLLDGNERVNDQVLTGPDDRLIAWTVERNVGFRLRGFTTDGTGGWEPAWKVGANWDLGLRGLSGTATDRFFAWEAPRDRSESSRTPRLVARSALTGEVVEEAFPPIEPVRLAARPDATEVAGVVYASLVVWRPGEEQRKVKAGTRAHFGAVAYHPSGKYLLTANNDYNVRVFDTATWQVVRQYKWDVGYPNSLAVSPDGTLAAVGGQKGRVVVWDLDL